MEMIQTRMTGARADAHRQDLLKSAERTDAPGAPARGAVAARAGDAPLGLRIPGFRRPSSEPRSGTEARGLAHQRRDQARWNPDANLLSGPVAAISPFGSLSRPAGSARVATCLSNATSCSSRSTSGAGTACQPWPPGARDPDTRRTGPSGRALANHWANAAPCGPSRACLYTGTYQHRNRSLLNGTPLDARFTNVALIARAMGYDPVLFGYTDTSVDPRTVPAATPGSSPTKVCCRGSTRWSWTPGSRAVPPGGAGWPRRASTSRPTHAVRPHWRVTRGRTPTGRPGLRPGSRRALPDGVHPPSGRGLAGAQRRPARSSSTPRSSGRTRHAGTVGYHDLYHADAVGPFVGASIPRRRPRSIPLAALVLALPWVAAPRDELERRQLRATYYGAQREVDDGLAPLFDYLDGSGLADDPGRADERPRRDGRRPLAAREARLLGRELPRAPHRGRPHARARRRPGPVSTPSPNRSTCSPPSASSSAPTCPSRPTAGRSARSSGASRPPSTGGTPPTSNGASPIRWPRWPNVLSGSR